MKRKFWLILILAILICIPALVPFLGSKFFHEHDFTHVARLTEMDQALRDGHFPVRWSKDLGYGYGMPQFNFYAPLPYYVAELFHLMGWSMLWSVKWLVILNYLVSFLIIYYLGESFWGPGAGVIAATAFIYAPYRAVDTYVRGAFGELTAITVLALALYCLVSWLRRPARKWWALSALSIGGLITAHNLVAFLALPELFILAVILAGIYHHRLKMIFQTAGIFILGLGVAAFYALPALGEIQAIRTGNLTSGFSDYHQHFLYFRQFFQTSWGYGGSISGPNDNISFSLGPVQIGLAALGGMSVLLLWRKQRRLSHWLVLSLGLLVIGSAFMATYKAQSIWEAISLFKYVQFPWRYLSVMIVFLSVMVGAVYLWVKTWPKGRMILMTLMLVGLLIGTNVWFFKPESYLKNNDSLYYTDINRIRTDMSSVIPDFIPLSMKLNEPPPPPSRYSFNPSVKSYTVDLNRTQEFHLTIETVNPATMSANISYFPGWTLFLNGTKTTFNLDPQTGAMLLNLPPNSEVTVSGIFEETPLRLFSDIVTLLSILVIVYALLPPINILPKAKHAGH